ncbi:MAG: YkuS family protein [Bacillota bacterium]|nr:YkuS family protein [Bacillota bacterium]HOB90697.1 YkuS family protein [Bacillota bacterium]HPZ53458.1 YkuS family protein [Bacillota bacterium]HQD18735.1 YkuS family protein [Bacillota bacterium]
MHKIGVDRELLPVRDFLRNAGYEVAELDMADSEAIRGFDAVVVSGLRRNMLGIQDTTNQVPIIDAAGMTPREVLNEVRLKIEKTR